MSATLLEGHVLDVLTTLPEGHFHTCATSPPYHRLRAYGTPPQTWPDGWVGELGQEPTVALYVEHLCAVFDAVGRVLRPDGTLWVNLAGNYTSDPGGQNGSAGTISRKAREANAAQGRTKRQPAEDGLKPLDWVDVPGMFARAMQRRGWYWRSDIVWAKASPLPESVSGTRFERCKGEKIKAGATAPGYGGATKLADPTAQYDVGRAAKAEWADCPGCAKCRETDGYVLRRGSGRPTKSYERVLLFAKGLRMSRVVQLADLPGERVHFSKHLGAAHSYVGLVGLCVRLATTIFDGAQEQDGFGLPPFYAEVWKECPDGSDGDFVRRLPAKHRATVLAARLLNADATTKEFLCQLYRLGVALTDGNQLLVGGGVALYPLSPGIYRDGETAIAVHDAGEVCKLDFVHGHIVAFGTTTCHYFYDTEAVREEEAERTRERASLGQTRTLQHDGRRGRNLRDVWSIALEPLTLEHYAAYPTALVERCLRAGTSEWGCCPVCGAPWARVVVTRPMVIDRTDWGEKAGTRTAPSGTMVPAPSSTTLGWRPTCTCPQQPPASCRALDPFGGSGTTALAANRLGLDCTLIELQPRYAALARRRIGREPLSLFATPAGGAHLQLAPGPEGVQPGAEAAG